MQRQNNVITQGRVSELSVNKVLRNTYLLLSMTLLFSAGTAAFATLTNAQPMNFLVLLGGMFGLLFLTRKLRNSIWGLPSIFLFTGFMGYTLGPVLNMYLHTFSNGPQLVMGAAAGTGTIFLALSAYAVTTRKNFSYLGGFLFVALLVGIMASLIAAFFNVPGLQLFISAAFVLIASGLILFDTSRIVNGGESNYIMATVQLYMDIYILFVNLLNILGALSGNRS